MKDLGFPVATANDLMRFIQFPVMKVEVKFPNPESEEQSDELLIAAVHLNQLVRVLWTAKGASEMEVIIEVQPPVTNSSPSSRSLLRPFFDLRNVKKVIIWSQASRRYEYKLTRAMTKTDDDSQSFNELTASVKCLQEHIRAQRWEQAVAQAESHAILMADYRIVYDNHFISINQGIDVDTAVIRYHAIKEMYIASAMSIAEVTLHLHQYSNALLFADYGLKHISHNSAFFQHLTLTHPTIMALFNNQLLSYTGTLAGEKDTKCSILLIRARAYMALENSMMAILDIKKARKILPNSETLASVSEAWHVMFGPFPESSPPPSRPAAS